jgi:hypothetical protein
VESIAFQFSFNIHASWLSLLWNARTRGVSDLGLFLKHLHICNEGSWGWDLYMFHICLCFVHIPQGWFYTLFSVATFWLQPVERSQVWNFSLVVSCQRSKFFRFQIFILGMLNLCFLWGLVFLFQDKGRLLPDVVQRNSPLFSSNLPHFPWSDVCLSFKIVGGSFLYMNIPSSVYTSQLHTHIPEWGNLSDLCLRPTHWWWWCWGSWGDTWKMENEKEGQGGPTKESRGNLRTSEHFPAILHRAFTVHTAFCHMFFDSCI